MSNEIHIVCRIINGRTRVDRDSRKGTSAHAATGSFKDMGSDDEDKEFPLLAQTYELVIIVLYH